MKKKSVTLFFVVVGLVVVYFQFDTFLEQSWHCEIKKQILNQEQYLKTIENTYKKEIYFWSWINYEGYLPAEIKLPATQLCTSSVQLNNAKDLELNKTKWLWSEYWSYLYPKSYSHFHLGLKQIADLNQVIFDKISFYESRRNEWWQRLSYDLKKICSLKGQVKRLKDVHEHLLTSCRQPASEIKASSKGGGGSVNLCLKDIKNMEILIQREEKPLMDNQIKMKQKWPYLPEEITCD